MLDVTTGAAALPLSAISGWKPNCLLTSVGGWIILDLIWQCQRSSRGLQIKS
jgi:hypothetical protein